MDTAAGEPQDKTLPQALLEAGLDEQDSVENLIDHHRNHAALSVGLEGLRELIEYQGKVRAVRAAVNEALRVSRGTGDANAVRAYEHALALIDTLPLEVAESGGAAGG